MADLRGNRVGRCCSSGDQHPRSFKQILHLDESLQVYLALCRRHMQYPMHYHDLGAATREKQYYLGVRERRPALDDLCYRWLWKRFLLPWRILFFWILEHLCGVRWRTHRRSSLPDIYAILELEILKALGALRQYEGTILWRILQLVRGPYEDTSDGPVARCELMDMVLARFTLLVCDLLFRSHLAFYFR